MAFWDDKKPKPENFATKEDIEKLQREMRGVREDIPTTKSNDGKKFIKMLGKGLNDIGESLNTSENKKRMRIAQMPGKRPPIARTKISNPIAGRGAGIKKNRISNAPLD